jgi:hypothetical protein
MERKLKEDSFFTESSNSVRVEGSLDLEDSTGEDRNNYFRVE